MKNKERVEEMSTEKRRTPIIVKESETFDSSSSTSVVADALRRGLLAIVPTETVYGLAARAFDSAAVERLRLAKGRRSGHALPLAVADFESARRFVKKPPEIAERLARAFWPGPLTIVFDVAQDVFSETFPLSREVFAPAGTLGFRVPQRPFLLKVLRELNEPIALTSANITGEPPAKDAKEALAALGGKVDVVVDGGTALFGRPSTVVSIKRDGFDVLREGALSVAAIREASVKTILFVCTGNTCRSPMAEALTKRALANRLGVSIEGLRDSGYCVLSAGVYAYDGNVASENARAVVRDDYGVSLDDFRSRLLSGYIVKKADRIYAMTSSHLDALLSVFPECESRAALLRPDGLDVSDPFGGSVDDYRECARQIDSCVCARLDEML